MPEIAGYVLGRLLGKGAFGETFEAAKDGKSFAVKIIKEEALDAGYDAKRFEREVRSLQKVKSHWIVEIIEAGHDLVGQEKRFYIVMELLKGQDLYQFAKTQNYKIPEDNLRSFLVQILEGLRTIHQEGIVHRDLKPQNIFVTQENEIKILDFGLVKMLNYTTLTTRPGQPVGTPMYIAPEILRSEEIDYRADFYSYGVMLYQLVTEGQFPFDASQPLELYAKVVNEPPIPPTARNNRVSSDLENTILTLLMKQPYQRFHSHQALEEKVKTVTFHVSERLAPLQPKRFPRFAKRCFFRLLHNEGVENIISFIKAGGKMDGYEFPANFLPRYQKSFKQYQEMDLNCILDPVTYRLPYTSFAMTEGLVNLPYVPDAKSVLEPNTIRSLEALQRYARGTIDWQQRWGAAIMVAPFHHARDLASPWINIDIKLMEEALDHARQAGYKKPVYGGLCLNIDSYSGKDSDIRLLNRYSRVRMDGYLFYADSIDERTTNPLQLRSYIDLIARFQELGKPVWACRTGTLGIGLMCLGADGMTTGIASLSSFSETDLLANRSPGPYDMSKKYYIPKLLLTLPAPLASDILKDQANSHLRPSNPFTSGWGVVELERAAKPHYLWERTAEVAEINGIRSSFERTAWFLGRVQGALRECERITRAKKIEFPAEKYQHLRTWAKLFGEINRTRTQ
jgi:serine/threonine protein kinase